MTLPTPSFETSFFDLPIGLKVFLREIGLGEEEKQVTQRSIKRVKTTTKVKIAIVGNTTDFGDLTYKVWLPSSKDEEVPF